MQDFFNQPYGPPLAYLAVVLWNYLMLVLNGKYNEMPESAFGPFAFMSWVPILNFVIALIFTIAFVCGMLGNLTDFIKSKVYK